MKTLPVGLCGVLSNTSFVRSENAARSIQARNESLTDKLEELAKKLARLQPGAVSPGVAMLKDPNAPNPPASDVKGRIVKIDARDRSLVEVSIGSDSGVNVDNTLEVYRLRPTP